MGKKWTVIADTREQVPWVWKASAWCAGSVARKLDQGDYALEGLEDRVVLERKRSPAELAANLTDDRFARELDRLKAVAYPVVVCEFTHLDLELYPEGSDIPKARRRFVKVKGPFLLRLLTQHQLAFPHVHWQFFHGRERAYEWGRALLKRAAEAAEGAARGP